MLRPVLLAAVVALCGVLAPTHAAAQPPDCLDYAQTPLPQPDYAALGGVARSPLVMGDLAYIPAGSAGLHVVDFGVAAGPFHLTTLTGFTDCRDLARLGDAVYAADDNGAMKVIDATDPMSPTVIGSGYFAGQTSAVAAAGSLLVAGDMGGTLHLYDASDPLAPVIVRHLSVASIILGLALEGDRLYVASGADGILVYDVSDPVTPVSVMSTAGGSFWGIDVQDGIVYAADYWGGRVLIYDATGPVPVPIGQTVPVGRTGAVDVAGTEMAVACGSEGVFVYDVTDPAVPVRVVGGIGAGNALGVVLESDRIWVADETAGCGPWDRTGRVDPVLADSGAAPVPEAVATAGSLAFVADSYRGLVILDIADPRRPVELSVLPFYNDAIDVVLNGTVAYVASWTSAFRVVDISDPTNPNLIVSPPTTGTCESLALGDGMLAVSLYGDGVDLFDVSVPSSPAWLANISTPDGARAAAFSGDVLFIAENYGGLAVYDVANPVVPLHLHQFPTDGRAAGVTVAGDALYLSTWQEGMQVYDISDPHNPLAQPEVAVPGWPTAMAVDGTSGYVATDYDGLIALDLSDPLAPLIENQLGWSAQPLSRVARPAFGDGVLVLPTSTASLVLARRHCFASASSVPDRPLPGAVLAAEVAPNPFNPRTTIRLTVPGDAPTSVTVEVCDIRGRHVRTLAADRIMKPGERSLDWSGTDDAGRPVASGVYLVRVATPGAGTTAKAVLLK